MWDAHPRSQPNGSVESNGPAPYRTAPGPGSSRTAWGSRWWMIGVGVVAGLIRRGLRRRTRNERGPVERARHATAIVDLSTPRNWRVAKRDLPLGGGTPISLPRCDAALRGRTRAVRIVEHAAAPR